MGSRESGKATTRSGHVGNAVAVSRLSNPVAIGVVVGPHGVSGMLRVRAYGSGKHLRKGMEPVVAGIRRRISASRVTPKGFLIEVDGTGSREDASSLKGEDLLLDRDELDPPEVGEFYVADLVGLAAVNEAGGVIGIVEDTFETAAHEVLVVREKGGQDHYIPFTLEHVPELDLSAGRLTVRPPEG